MGNETLNPRFEIMESDAKTKLARDFPEFYMGKFEFVDRNTRLLIDDVSYRTSSSLQESLELLCLACIGKMMVFSADSLTRALEQKIASLLRVVNSKKTVVLFPGNGASVVKDLLPEKLFEGMTTIALPTQRKVDPKTKEVQGVSISDVTKTKQALHGMRIENFIVIDDVIATGATLTALKEAFPVRNTQWYGAAFLALSPLQNRTRAKMPSGIDGYSSIITPIVYQGTNGIPPLNSLSTLIGQSEKSAMVRRRYMEDYVQDQEIFTEMVDQFQAVELQRR